MTYKIITAAGRMAIKCEDTGKWFAGYDWMGTDNWTDVREDAFWMVDADNAQSVMNDLIAAGEDAKASKHEKVEYHEFSFRELCESMDLDYKVMVDYHGGPVPEEAWMKRT